MERCWTRRLTGRAPAGTSLLAKLDALGQWQGGAVVDRGGAAAHVLLPGVGAGFSAAAGVFFAAEGAADLGAGGADIDAGQTAVGAGRAQEAVGLAHVAGTDRRREPLRDAVVQVNRLVQRVVAGDVQQRGEGL